MKLSKVIPARRETVVFDWCKKEFLVMGPDFRNARRDRPRKFDKCSWCNHKFNDGEMMALACPEKSTNKMLCQSCATELLASDKA